MADSDEEQVEALKKWLDENGTSLAVGILLAVVGVFGFHSWQDSTREAGEAAAELYQSLTEAMAIAPSASLTEETVQSSRFIADTLKNDYESSTYAQFAALLMAKIAVEENDLELAERELEWIIARKPAESIAAIAKIRLARVYLTAQKRDDALALLETFEAGAHESSRQEALGDVYLTLDRQDDARAAYQAALDGIVEGSAKPILEMKLRDVPVVANAPADPAEADDVSGDDATVSSEAAGS